MKSASRSKLPYYTREVKGMIVNLHTAASCGQQMTGTLNILAFWPAAATAMHGHPSCSSPPSLSPMTVPSVGYDAPGPTGSRDEAKGEGEKEGRQEGRQAGRQTGRQADRHSSSIIWPPFHLHRLGQWRCYAPPLWPTTDETINMPSLPQSPTSLFTWLAELLTGWLPDWVAS